MKRWKTSSNSQYYELCTCFKEIPTTHHDTSMFCAVCVQTPPHPPHISCVSIHAHSTFWSFCFFSLIRFLFPFVQLTKEAKQSQNSVPMSILYTQTHLPGETPPLILLNYYYYIFDTDNPLSPLILL